MVTTYEGKTYEKYSDYLKGGHWIQFRKDYTKTHAKACVICYDEKQLQIHHRYYRHPDDGYTILGREKFLDVVFLCDRCHECLHARKLERHLMQRHFRRSKNLIALRLLMDLSVAHRFTGISEIKKRQGEEKRLWRGKRVVHDFKKLPSIVEPSKKHKRKKKKVKQANRHLKKAQKQLTGIKQLKKQGINVCGKKLDRPYFLP